MTMMTMFLGQRKIVMGDLPTPPSGQSGWAAVPIRSLPGKRPQTGNGHDG